MHEFGIPVAPTTEEIMMDVQLSAFVVDAYFQEFESEEK